MAAVINTGMKDSSRSVAFVVFWFEAVKVERKGRSQSSPCSNENRGPRKSRTNDISISVLNLSLSYLSIFKSCSQPLHVGMS